MPNNDWALGAWGQFTPHARHWYRHTWGDALKGGDESTVAIEFCGPAVDTLSTQNPPHWRNVPLYRALSIRAFPVPSNDWHVGDPPQGRPAVLRLTRTSPDDLERLRCAADAVLVAMTE